jgi:hypothetical protein
MFPLSLKNKTAVGGMSIGKSIGLPLVCVTLKTHKHVAAILYDLKIKSTPLSGYWSHISHNLSPLLSPADYLLFSREVMRLFCVDQAKAAGVPWL